MPVVLPRRGVQRLAGMDLEDLAVPGPEPGNTLGDAEVLPAGVGVPGSARTGREPDDGYRHALVGVMRCGQEVHPDVAGELLGWVLDRGRGGFDVHAGSVQRVSSTLVARRSSIAV
jgi:hypothetical protein